MASSPIITLEMTNPLAEERAREVDSEDAAKDTPDAPVESPVAPVGGLEPSGDKPDAG